MGPDEEEGVVNFPHFPLVASAIELQEAFSATNRSRRFEWFMTSHSRARYRRRRSAIVAHPWNVSTSAIESSNWIPAEKLMEIAFHGGEVRQ